MRVVAFENSEEGFNKLMEELKGVPDEVEVEIVKTDGEIRAYVMD